MKAVLGNQPKIVRDLLALPTCPKDFTQFKVIVMGNGHVTFHSPNIQTVTLILYKLL